MERHLAAGKDRQYGTAPWWGRQGDSTVAPARKIGPIPARPQKNYFCLSRV